MHVYTHVYTHVYAQAHTGRMTEAQPDLLRRPATPPCAHRGDTCNCEYCPPRCNCECHLCRRRHEASDDTLLRKFVCLKCHRSAKNSLPAAWLEKRAQLEQNADQLSQHGDDATADAAQRALQTFAEPRFATDHEASTPSQFLNEARPKGCPGCAAPMLPVGPSFETPKQADKKAWARLTKLIDAGFVFSGCPCCTDRNHAALARLGVTDVAEVK